MTRASACKSHSALPVRWPPKPDSTPIPNTQYLVLSPPLPPHPQWLETHLERLVPSLEPHGVALLRAMLSCCPQQRITARAAKLHPYFADIEGILAANEAGSLVPWTKGAR